MALRPTPPRAAAHVPSLRPSVKARRRPALLIVGTLAICLGALGSTTLYSSLSHSHQIIRVARAVDPGQVVSSADLSIVSLPSVSGIDVVPASALADVIGKPAAHELRAGTLLHPDDTHAIALPADTMTVGLTLAAGRLPSKNLPAGSKVILVAVPGSGAAVDKPDALFHATLLSSPTRADDGTWLVDVAVTAADAQRIARLGSVQQLALLKGSDR